MNYLRLIKNFWLQHNLHALTLSETTLYFYLVEVNNLCEWKETFTRNNIKVKADLGISSVVLSNARRRLKEVGLIDYHTTIGNAIVTYRLLPPEYGKKKVDEQTDHSFDEEIRWGSGEVTEQVSDQVGARLNKTKYKTKTKTKLKTKTPIIPKGEECSSVNYEEVMNLFNTLFAEKLTRVTSLNDNRKKAIRKCIARYGEGSIKEVFEKVLKSAFLLGDGENGWRCDFDWIFKSSNFIKILEGVYENVGTRLRHSEQEKVSEKMYEQF